MDAALRIIQQFIGSARGRPGVGPGASPNVEPVTGIRGGPLGLLIWGVGVWSIPLRQVDNSENTHHIGRGVSAINLV